MHTRMPADAAHARFPNRITPRTKAVDGKPEPTARAPAVRAESLKTAIVQLRSMAEANSGRSNQQALVTNLMRLRMLGVDEEILDLVVEMVLAQDVDEEMTAAINYLASGFLLALLTFREEGAAPAPIEQLRHPVLSREPVGDR